MVYSLVEIFYDLTGATLDARCQRGRHELIKVTVKDALRISAFHARPQIFYQLIGLQDIGADLMTPADIGFCVGFGLSCILALLKFLLIETCPQHGPCRRTVLVLGSLILTLDDNPGLYMRDPHRTVRRVDVLTTRPGSPVGVDANILFGNVNLDLVVNLRKHPD